MSKHPGGYKRLIALFFFLLFCFWVEWPICFFVSIFLVGLSFMRKPVSWWNGGWNKIGHKWQLLFDWLLVFVVASVIVVGLKSYFIDVFRLPSNSMDMTVGNGDLIIINKFLMGPRLNSDDPDAYYRAAGIKEVGRHDLIVFNFPEGDTLLINSHNESYYSVKRQFGKLNASDADQFLGERSFKIVTRRPKYIKRVIALPGDTLEIREGEVYVNGKNMPVVKSSLRKYRCVGGDADSIFNAMRIKPYNRYLYKNEPLFELEVSLFEQYPQLRHYFTPFQLQKNYPDPHVFPYNFLWNTDFIGPVIIPSKGMVIHLNESNISMYARIIDVYENNDLEIKGTKIFINGVVSSTYVCKMDYYWVMGDNQSHSFDSRYWGFLPENHIIGISPWQIHLD